MLDKETRKITEFKPSENKGQNKKSVASTLLRINEYIKNNFLEYLGTDKVYSVDLTFSVQPKTYNEFNNCLKNFIRKLRRMNKDVKYIIIKEIGDNGGYHAHAIIAEIELTKEIVQKKWTYGQQIKFKIPKTDEDLLYKASYLTNITGDSKAAKRKSQNQIYFPAKKHLYFYSKNLEPPVFTDGEPNQKIEKIIFETPENKRKRLKGGYKTCKIA